MNSTAKSGFDKEKDKKGTIKKQTFENAREQKEKRREIYDEIGNIFLLLY